jgi:hypothetical protein
VRRNRSAGSIPNHASFKRCMLLNACMPKHLLKAFTCLFASRAGLLPDVLSQLTPQRPGGHGASAARRIADVLSMAQAAVKKEKHRAAATLAPLVAYDAGLKERLHGRSASARRMCGVNAVSRKEDNVGTATSPFVTPSVCPVLGYQIMLLVLIQRDYLEHSCCVGPCIHKALQFSSVL